MICTSDRWPITHQIRRRLMPMLNLCGDFNFDSHLDLRPSKRHNVSHHFAAWAVLKRLLFSPDAWVIITHTPTISCSWTEEQRTSSMNRPQDDQRTHCYSHLPGLSNAPALMWQWYLAPSFTPNLQRCRWGEGVGCWQHAQGKHL